MSGRLHVTIVAERKTMRHLSLPLFGLLIACGSPGGSSRPDGATEGSDATTAGDDGGASETGTLGIGDSSGDSSAEGTTGGDSADDVPARGIVISRVDANSGVAVPIVRAGSWVGPEDRNAPLPKNRNTAFRVYVELYAGPWIAREIEARLTLTGAGGAQTVHSSIIEVAAPSQEELFESTFIIEVPAEEIQPETRFNVRLYEVEDGYESIPEPSAAPAALPEPGLVGIESSYQNMRITLVPIDYQSPECTALPELSEENVSNYVDHLFQLNPVENIDLEIHEPVLVEDLDLSDVGGVVELAQRVSELRAIEQPDPNVYYYGMFENCEPCAESGCALGFAVGVPGPSQSDAES